MKKIYVLLTHTGTILSKIIKSYTKDEFSHVSISLDSELKELYSFGRLNPYNPFVGGFVHEGIEFGTFRRFKKTECRLYAIEVTEEQYNNAKEIVEYIKNSKKLHNFNMIGLLAVGFNKKISLKNSFYCAEFVKYVLDKSNIKKDLPEFIRPEDFKNIENSNIIYEGLLRNYQIHEKKNKKIKEKLLKHLEIEGIA